MPERPDGNGAIFTATGEAKYTALAVRAAASIRQHNPGLAIDLYTDRAQSPPGFDRVHVLDSPWARSRIDAVATSRFARTLMLDSDVIVLADIGDIFEVLDRFDIALAHDQERNSVNAQRPWKTPLPNAFPQFNGGVIAVRHGEALDRMLADWAAAVRDHATGRDQQVLREILWAGDLRIATLPPEYNLMDIDLLRAWSPKKAAPRIVHQPKFHEEFDRFDKAPDPVAERIGRWSGARVPEMLAADRDLARRAGREPVLPETGAGAALRRLWRRLR